jgi:serine/threonine protein kinase
MSDQPRSYLIGSPIVEGSTSVIFEAYDPFLGRQVALKRLRPESQQDPVFTQRFLRETRIGSLLQHPGVPPVYDSGTDELGSLYYTTQLLEGRTLASLIASLSDPAEQHPPDFHHLLHIFLRVCDTIAYAHCHGIYHGSLHPDYITVGHFGEVFVLNWALATVRNERPEEHPVPLQISPADCQPPRSEFTAPEMAAGQIDDVGPLTDVYALGAILFQILTRVPPLAATDSDTLLEAILTGSLLQPSSLPSTHFAHCPDGNIPDALLAIALKAMSLAPEDRIPSAQDLQHEVTRDENASAGHRIWKGLGKPAIRIFNRLQQQLSSHVLHRDSH